jgi:hypothetical protein
MIAVPRRYSEIVNVFCKSKSGLLLAVVLLPRSSSFYRTASSTFTADPAYIIA